MNLQIQDLFQNKISDLSVLVVPREFLMDKSVYDDIVRSIRSRDWSDLDILQSELSEEFSSVAKHSIRSIICQEYQRHIKITFRTQHSEERKAAVYDEVMAELEAGTERSEGSLIRLAGRSGSSPALTARSVLELHCQAAQDTQRNTVSLMMKDTTLIDDGNLALEVFLSTIKDDSYGCFAEAIKQSIGEEHEQKIKDILTDLNIPFADENDMRSQGYDKTPDIKLDVPVAVDGFIVNWIESKALFGDPEAHAGYLRDQLWSYINRFGSGLVIYWFGYVAQLDLHRNAGIILRESFPSNIVRFKPGANRNPLDFENS